MVKIFRNDSWFFKNRIGEIRDAVSTEDAVEEYQQAEGYK